MGIFEILNFSSVENTYVQYILRYYFITGINGYYVKND